MPEGDSSEQWLPVVGYEGWYSVSNLGNLRREAPGRNAKIGTNRKPYVDRYGYAVTCLHRNGKAEVCKIHRLVVDAFVARIVPGHSRTVNHKNGIKTDNRADNLEYVTPSENVRHAYSIGLAPVGEKHCRAKLNNSAIRQIREMQSLGLSQRKIAQRFNVSHSTVGCILRGYNWSHVK